MYNLWLDDIREPFDDRGWLICRNIAEFKTCIQVCGLPKFISFDHDLDDNGTGFDCAKWLIDQGYVPQEGIYDYQVHSANPPGRDNIVGLLESWRKFNEKSS